MKSKKTRVLAVGAHPDDLEILCGGTLARFAQGGHSVIMACATNGGWVHNAETQESQATADVRKREFLRSSAVIGAQTLWLDAPDGMLFDSREIRQEFVRLIREVSPDLIITHSPTDYHPDHVATSRIILDASFFLSAKIPVYYMDTANGVGFQPTEYVDVSDTFEVKLLMLACHESQLRWFREVAEIDLVDMVSTLARLRGYQCNVRFAEGFVGVQSWLRCRPHRMLP